jgi:hypothetical protein
MLPLGLRAASCAALGLVSEGSMLRCLIAASLLGLMAPALAVAQLAPPQAKTPGAAGIPLPTSETKQWEFGVLITAASGPCTGLAGTFPIPLNWPEQQVKIVREDILPSVRSHTFREQEGLKQLHFEIPQLPAGSQATCLLVLEITRTDPALPADTSLFAIPKSTAKESRKYLGTSPLIEATNAKFKALAKELTAGKETPWSQVEALYDGIRERIKFQPDNKDTRTIRAYKGALGALRDGAADKEDLTSAFVAVCRAHKVPARLVWVYDGVDAEFFLEDAAGKGRWFACHLYGGEKQFGTYGHLRPIIEKGDNFRVAESKVPQRFVPEFLTGKGGSPQVEFRRRLAVGQ